MRSDVIAIPIPNTRKVDSQFGVSVNTPICVVSKDIYQLTTNLFGTVRIVSNDNHFCGAGYIILKHKIRKLCKNPFHLLAV